MSQSAMSVYNRPFDLEKTFFTVFNLRCSIVSVAYLAIHEWMTIIIDEINLIHPSRWSLVKTGYLFCRYYPLVFGPFLAWGYMVDHSCDICQSLVRPMHALLAPLAFFPHGILVLRAYGFSGQKKLYLAVMLICYTLQIALDIWVYCFDTRPLPEPFYMRVGNTGCFPDYSDPDFMIRIGLTMLAATLTDFVSLLVVILHCRSLRGQHGCLVRYFRRQGLGSFVAMALINGCAAIAYYQPHREYGRVGLPFNLVVSNLIACRITLQLRHHASLTRGVIQFDAGLDLDRSTYIDHWVITEYSDRPLSPITFAPVNAHRVHDTSSNSITDLQVPSHCIRDQNTPGSTSLTIPLYTTHDTSTVACAEPKGLDCVPLSNLANG